MATAPSGKYVPPNLQNPYQPIPTYKAAPPNAPSNLSGVTGPLAPTNTPVPNPTAPGAGGAQPGQDAIINTPAMNTTGPSAGKVAPAPPNGFAQFVNSPLGNYLKSQAAAPAAGNYLNAFQGALGSARSDIAQQLAGALSDIKANQGYAQQALGQLPGAINTSYGTADKLMNIGQHAAQAGMNAPGLNAATGANTGPALGQYMAPERAAIAGEKAGEQANVPLLGVGINQAASQEAAAANNAALSDYSNLAQQQAQLQGQAAIAAQQQQAQQAQQGQQNIFGLVQNGLQNQYTLKQIAAQNAGAGGYGSPQQVQQVVNSPQYTQAVQQVQSKGITSLAALQAAYPGNPILWQTVASQYGLK